MQDNNHQNRHSDHNEQDIPHSHQAKNALKGEKKNKATNQENALDVNLYLRK